MEVCKKRCNQCLFGKNKIVPEARKQEILKEIRETQSYFVCHKTGNTMCRGFYDERGGESQILRISERLNVVKFI